MPDDVSADPSPTGRGNCSGLIILQRGKNILPAPFLLLLELLVYQNSPLLKVYARPHEPQDLPSRIPVNNVTVKRFSKRWPWIAFRKALLCSSSRGFIGFRTTRGRVQASEGLNRRYPNATACWRALWSTPWTFFTVFGDRPGFPPARLPGCCKTLGWCGRSTPPASQSPGRA